MKIKTQEEFNEFIDEIIDGLHPINKETALFEKENKDLKGLCLSIFADVAFSERCFSDLDGDLLLHKEESDYYATFEIMMRYKNIVICDFAVYVYEDKFETLFKPHTANHKDLVYFFKYMMNYLEIEER